MTIVKNYITIILALLACLPCAGRRKVQMQFRFDEIMLDSTSVFYGEKLSEVWYDDRGAVDSYDFGYTKLVSPVGTFVCHLLVYFPRDHHSWHHGSSTLESEDQSPEAKRRERWFHCEDHDKRGRHIRLTAYCLQPVKGTRLWTYIKARVNFYPYEPYKSTVVYSARQGIYEKRRKYGWHSERYWAIWKNRRLSEQMAKKKWTDKQNRKAVKRRIREEEKYLKLAKQRQGNSAAGKVKQ